MSMIMKFFLHVGLLIMLVLPLRVKKRSTEAGGRREQNKTKIIGIYIICLL